MQSHDVGPVEQSRNWGLSTNLQGPPLAALFLHTWALPLKSSTCFQTVVTSRGTCSKHKPTGTLKPSQAILETYGYLFSQLLHSFGDLLG